VTSGKIAAQVAHELGILDGVIYQWHWQLQEELEHFGCQVMALSVQSDTHFLLAKDDLTPEGGKGIP
jgi:hypothetical protein